MDALSAWVYLIIDFLGYIVIYFTFSLPLF